MMLWRRNTMNNSVLNILKQYLDWEKSKEKKDYDNLTWEKKDELRLQNDNDAMYYYKTVRLAKDKALCADTIISFWTLYSRLLKLEANWSAYKTVKSLERLIYQINTTRKNDYTEKIRKVNENIETFAEICYTKGNYMLLPKRIMNTLRYKISEDRIDLTLYECFENGELAFLFEDEEELKTWIDEQKLSSLFVNGEKCRDNINWFVEEDKHKLIYEMSREEIYQYLGKSISLIDERNVININV